MSKEILQEFDPLTKGNKLHLKNKDDQTGAPVQEHLGDMVKDNVDMEKEELYNSTSTTASHLNNNATSSSTYQTEQNFHKSKPSDESILNTNDNSPVSDEHERNDNGDEEDDDAYFYDFQLFIKQLKDPRADPLVRYIKSFLKNFCTQRPIWTVTEQVKLVYDFKKFIYDKFKHFEPFKSLNESKFINAKEGLEKLIMGKLYSRCFSPKFKQLLKIELDTEHQDDIDKDAKLIEKINEFKFIELKNLDLPFITESKLKQFIKLASQELNKINKFKSPRDKLICILNCCKIIFGLLRYNNLEKDGADSFIPLLIFIIIKSDIEDLVSNVKYIERFRYEKLNIGEQSYYLSSLQGAVNFILELNFDNLTIDDRNTFNEKYKENQERLLKSNQSILLEDSSKESDSNEANIQPINIPSLEDVTTSIGSIFTDFISQYNASTPTDVYHSDNNENNSTDPILTRTRTQEEEIEEDKRIQEMIANLEAKEHRETLDTLGSMFPDIDSEILEDICIAKKYRMGECVDTLLALFN